MFRLALKKIGLVTIGQSPRSDILPDMLMILGDGYEVLEVGALDDYSTEDIKKLEIKQGDPILVTRMKDGTEVKVTKDFIVPKIQEGINQLDKEGVNVILLLCTGKFPEFKSSSLIVMPSELVRGAVNASLRKGRLGVIYPAREQMAKAREEWGREDLQVYADWASPYGDEKHVDALADRLSKQDLDLILLNCMGFNYRMKQMVVQKTGRPVIQANALVARVLKELT